MLRSLRIVFGTRRGLKGVSTKSLAFFGLVSAVAQFYSAIFVPSHSLDHPLAVVIATAVCALAYGIGSTWPRQEITRTFKANAHDITLNIKVGDMLASRGQIVVGFSDTFDTDTSGKVISATSLQGQLLARRYNNDPKLLDNALSTALKDAPQEAKESRSNKRLGKLVRYPIGTVAVLGSSKNDRIYALAYSRMNNDLVAESTVHDVWSSLGQLWDAVYTHGQRNPISMPLVGTGLARINALDRESMLRMTLISFVARSREKLICNELTVYIHPSDQRYINMLELRAFIKTL